MSDAAVPRYLMGVDLGKTADYTAIVIAQPTSGAKPKYDLRHIERVPLRSRYTDIASYIAETVADLRQPIEVRTVNQWGMTSVAQKRPQFDMVLDFTGVGIAVAEIFLAAGIDCPIILVTITGGGKPTWDEVGIHVPKADLVSVVQRCLQEERLRMPADDPTSDLLARELSDFQAVIGRTGHVSYGVVADWRDGQHDDLVLAASLALWWGESRPTPEIW
jgi:hypothetical protein